MAKVRIYILLLVCWMSGSQADQFLKKEDIPKVMAELFAYHIESKELNPAIVRRSFKIYLEQFDPEKTYLLQGEVHAFLSISEDRAKEIADHMQKGDFSDFLAVNALIQKAIVRSQRLRKAFEKQLQSTENLSEQDSTTFSQYAADEAELTQRQKNRLNRFFAFHNRKNPISTAERKEKFFALIERKMKRQENPYLFLDSQGKAFDAKQKDHFVSLRILKAFAKSLDAHTSFFSEEEAYEMRMNLEKQFEGLGVVLSEGVDGILISEIMPGSPAHKNGQIKVNDVLVEIDGVSLKGEPFELALQLLKKKDKAEHILGVERTAASGSKIVRVELKKAPIVMNQDRLTYTFEPHENGIIGKITMNSFYENGEGITSEKDLKEALVKLQEHGPIVGLILDFRENAGGFLSQAVKVAGLFISSGVVVVSKYSQGKIHYLRNLDPKTYYNGPLIILTSKLSASAAEIVAQSLQDYGAAIIVGDERTFGKGSIQFQTVTDEKSEYFYKVTVGKYYTVSGRTTQIEGVAADILVPTHFAPFHIGEKYLEYPLTADRIPSAYTDSLADLDGKIKLWFQKNYLPFLQKKITFWQKMLPQLRKSSADRLASDARFQKFLATQEKIRAKLPQKEIEWDQLKSFAQQDLQMEESVHIMKDMIILEEESRAKAQANLAPPFFKAG